MVRGRGMSSDASDAAPDVVLVTRFYEVFAWTMMVIYACLFAAIALLPDVEDRYLGLGVLFAVFALMMAAMWMYSLRVSLHREHMEIEQGLRPWLRISRVEYRSIEGVHAYGFPWNVTIVLDDGRSIRVADNMTRTGAELPEVEPKAGDSMPPTVYMQRIAALIEQRVADARSRAGLSAGATV